MISDVIFHMIVDLDRYLDDPDFDPVYVGENRARIVRLRDDRMDLLSTLDQPPVTAAAANDRADQSGSSGSKLVDRMMSDKAAFEIATAYFSKADLLRRGWSKDQILQLLGRRDWETANPHCPGAAPMSCWEQSRVLQAEDSLTFRQSRRNIRNDGVPVPE